MSETIEQDAAASPLSPAEPSMAAGLVALGKSFRAIMGLKLAEIGLHPGQDELLLALDIATPLPVSHVAETLEVRPSTVSKMIDRLVTQGFIDRVSSDRDARLTLIQITKNGVAKVEQINDVRAAIDEEISTAIKGSSLSTTATDVEALSQIVASRLHRLR